MGRLEKFSAVIGAGQDSLLQTLLWPMSWTGPGGRRSSREAFQAATVLNQFIIPGERQDADPLCKTTKKTSGAVVYVFGN